MIRVIFRMWRVKYPDDDRTYETLIALFPDELDVNRGHAMHGEAHYTMMTLRSIKSVHPGGR